MYEYICRFIKFTKKNSVFCLLLFIVSGYAAADELPSVTLTAPAEGSVVIHAVKITASAGDDDGISRVEFHAGGVKLGEDTTAPYEFNWNAGTVADGVMEISAVAFDTTGQSASDSVTVTVCNHEEYEYITQWDYDGSPGGIAADDSGNIYLSSPNGSIKKYSSAGKPLLNIPDQAADYNFRGAASVHLYVDHNGYIYITNNLNLNVIKFDSQGNYVTKWGSEGTGDTQFKYPLMGISGDSENNLYVCDRGNNRIVKYSSDGDFITGWYADATSIAVDASDNVYVCTCWGFNDQVFDSQGNFIRHWRAADSEPVVFDDPRDIAVDRNGSVYVADSGYKRVVKYDSAGQYVTRWGSNGTGNMQFKNTFGITVDHEDNVYVLDYVLCRTSKFRSKWKPETEITAPAEDSVVSNTVAVEAQGTTAFGQVTSVAFYIDSVLQASDESSPYTFQWDSTPQADGIHLIRARVYNNLNNDTEAEIPVIVNNSGDKVPVISITGPGENEIVQAPGVTVCADVSDDKGVKKVQFYIDDILVAEDFAYPYSFAWDVSAHTNGLHHIKAKAIDSIGQSAADETAVMLNKGGDPLPEVSITTPAGGSIVNMAVEITAVASDNSGIDSVEFFVNDELKKTVSSPPYNYTWDTTAYTDGISRIKAKVRDDLWQTDEHEISVIVNNSGDNLPQIRISEPENSEILSRTVEVVAEAADDRGIDRVEFFIDDEMKSTEFFAPYKISWDTSSSINGNHTIKVVAYDSIGQSSSHSITARVDDTLISADISGASAVFIDNNRKLRKLSLSGITARVFEMDPDVEYMQFDESGNLYLVFSEKQLLKDGSMYLLIKINPGNSETQGIDSNLSRIIWNENSVSPNLQFDGSGCVYYLAENGVGKVVLRKYVNEENITELINDNIEVSHWHVGTDGTVVLAGETVSTSTSWLRKISISGEISNIANPARVGWILNFPDNHVYCGIDETTPYYGVYRLSSDLSYINSQAALAPFIGFADAGFTPEYAVNTIVSGHDPVYAKGFRDTGGVHLFSADSVLNNDLVGLTGAGSFKTIVRYYPVPEIVELELIDRVSLMKVYLNRLIVAGTKDGINRLIVYDMVNPAEKSLLSKNIEIYHLDTLANGNILFDGLNFENNSYVVGMFENTATSAGTDKINAYGTYTELATLSAQPLAFQALRESDVQRPVVATQSVSSITDSSAQGNGMIVNYGASSPYQHGVCWSKTEEPTVSDSHTEEGAVGSTGAFPSVITGLEANTTYFVRAYAVNTAGISYGNEVFFTSKISQAEQPVISLSKTSLKFGCSGGIKTGTQSFFIANASGGTLNWTISGNASWLSFTPESGSGTGKVTVSIDSSGLSAGTYTGEISVTDKTAGNSPQTVSVTLKVFAAGASAQPFGHIVTPADASTVRSSVPVTGWALDDIEVEKVEIFRESGSNLVYIGKAVFVEGARSDLEAAFPAFPLNYRAGWGYMLLTYGLPDQGADSDYVLHAIATDVEGNCTDLGTKRIHCDNRNAVKPFGAIATPAQGGEAGGSYMNWGWALTPAPNIIPTDGSSIRVVVDGTTLGKPVYNLYRSDIATLFPGYLNCEGAAGYYLIDTSKLKNGVHTIAWQVTDSAGHADGIGSRYFSVLNAESSSLSTAFSFQNQSSGLNFMDLRNIENYIADFSPVRCLKDSLPGDTGREVFARPGVEFFEISGEEVSIFALELNFPGAKPDQYAGFSRVGRELRKLPVGSTFDKEKGIFYWQPGPGFIGEYRLIFLDTRHKTRKEVKVNIKPRQFSSNRNPR